MTNAIFFHLNDPGFVPSSIKFDLIQNIDKYENNSIDRVILQDLLDYYHDHNIKELLQHIKNKIKPDGYLSIQSADIKQLAIAIAFGEINESLAKEIMYPNKKSIHTIYDIQQILSELSFSVENKKYINIFEYYILAKNV